MKSSASTSPVTAPVPSPYLLSIISRRAEVGEVDLDLEERTAMLSQPPEQWSPKIRQIVAEQQIKILASRARIMGDAWAKSNPI